ncbi:hypothetical protein ZIOFF_040494 [Zingiber officinale]|uniref:Non-specific serine/threonine protein kinase n=1 Tax=Zingiber officinale TaxID=94328 RepID=A0A8J5G6A9_ZINOF|nr:hypothetical protein ZIOFF_040494 [Zingiber officinale]
MQREQKFNWDCPLCKCEYTSWHRRDDLESLGYVLMYFLRGRLVYLLETFYPLSTTQTETSWLYMFSSAFPGKALCRGYPTEFASYFHYCRSLRFEDKPDYAYLKRLYRELFIREGFQFDYVFDWTILKYQQSQIAGAPPYAIGPNAGPSSGLVPAVANDRQSGGEEGRTGGWLATDPSRHGRASLAVNIGNLSKQKAPMANDPAASKDAMVSDSTFMGWSSGSSRRLAVSGGRDIVGIDADQSRTRTAEASPVTYHKVSSGQRSSPIVSSTSGRKPSAIKNYESALKGIEGLHFDSKEKN